MYRRRNQSVNVRPVSGGFTPHFRQRLFFRPQVYAHPFYHDPSLGMIVPCIEVAEGTAVPAEYADCGPSQYGGTTCCARASYGWAQRCPPGTVTVLLNPITDLWGRRWYLCRTAVSSYFTPFYRTGSFYPFTTAIVRPTFRRGSRRGGGRRGRRG